MTGTQGKNRGFLPVFAVWHGPCNIVGIGRIGRPDDLTRGFIMFANSELANRLLAAFGALAITPGLLVASFAPPAQTAATMVLA